MVRNAAALREDPGSIPWRLTIAYNLSPELPGTFFCLLQVPGMHVPHTHMCRHSHMYVQINLYKAEAIFEFWLLDIKVGNQ